MLDNMEKRPGIFRALITSATFAFVLATVVLLLPIQKTVQDIEISAQAKTTHHAAYALQLAVSTLVEREWTSLVGFSGFVDPTSYETTRSFTDAVVEASEGVVWAGIASLDGRVIVGSGGALEDEDVSQAAWFRRGLRGDRVSAPVASGNTTTDALSDAVVYMSRPVRTPDGSVAGVAVYKVALSWFTDYVAATADRLEVDVALLGESGKTLFSHGNRVSTPISSAVKTQSELGSAYAGFARGEGNESYVAGVIPDVVAGKMPQLRLALVVRVPTRNEVGNLGAAVTSMTWIVVGLFAVIGAVAVGFALHFLKPISALAEAAASIADGKKVYPTESHSSREAMLLSSALVRLRPANE